ncbi:MAG: hypothetical protein IJZ91_03290 [Oscillospiraceae bacterium]|nr:hypothetical protein [Oscillospiraceae bacterium]
MKKIISLLLVLCLVFALAPAAYAADTIAGDPKNMTNDGGEGIKVSASSKDSDENKLYTKDASAGIVKDDGHLYSCPGGNCDCYGIILQADREYKALESERQLKVWMSVGRDADGLRHDTVVAEIELPYNDKNVDKNQEYLDGKEAVKELLEDFYGDDDIAEELYRPIDFIQTQVLGSLSYAEANNSGVRHVQYRLMDAGGYDPDVSLGFVEDGKRDGGREYIFSTDALDTEVPVEDVTVKLGGFSVKLPESCQGAAFTLALCFNYDGSVRVLLSDDSGKLIPGAVVSAVLPGGADADTVAVTLDDKGNSSPVGDSAVDSGCIVFTAPTGDDLFALE